MCVVPCRLDDPRHDTASARERPSYRPHVVKPAPATVIIPCYTEDRWHSLMATIASVAGQEPPPREIIVSVDNNSQLRGRLEQEPHGVTVVENRGQPGVADVRNAGAAIASSPFLAFIDDDVVACRGWLHSLLEPFAAPDVIGTGGFVRAVWTVARPPWFPDEFAWVVGASYSSLPTTVAPVRNVWGENMAVRTDIFRTVGGFRSAFTKIGVVSRPEDTDLCIRMAAQVPTGRWMYVPDAAVEHQVNIERTTLRYFLIRSYWEGQGKIEMSHHLGSDRDLRPERDWFRKAVLGGIGRNVRSSATGGGGAAAAQAAALVAGSVAAATGASVSLARATLRRLRPARDA
jgi:GT2 family glycosyltransferase